MPKDDAIFIPLYVGLVCKITSLRWIGVRQTGFPLVMEGRT